MAKLKPFLLLLFSASLALLAPLVAPATTPLPHTTSSFSYTLVHRDAPQSVIRSSAADTSDLPLDMPMKDFLGFGRGLQARLSSRRQHRKAHPAAAARFVRGHFSYFHEQVGDFYLTAKVGTPPQEIIFLLDTGSELAWTRCSPCKLCTPSEAPVFQRNRSSSYFQIPCSSPICVQSTGFAGGCSNTTKSCIFLTLYADKTMNEGFLSLDKFTVGFTNLETVFGCAVVDSEAVESQPSSGVMGLNAGPFSFLSQLAEKGYAKKFSYCVPDRFSSTNSSGLIVFGESNLSLASASLHYTPLVPRYAGLGNLYYYVQVTGVSLGKKLLPIPQSAFTTNLTGIGGTVLDSGSSITHLVDSAYIPLVNALINATVHLHPFSLPSLGADLCYKIPSNASQLPELPTITFHFLHGADLELLSDSILYPIGLIGDKIVLCIAFAGSSDAGLALNIIGNYQQQNYWVEYDLPKSRVGFAKAKCVVD